MPSYAIGVVIDAPDAEIAWETMAQAATWETNDTGVRFVGDPRPIRTGDDYDSEEVARAIILHDLPADEYEHKEPATDD